MNQNNDSNFYYASINNELYNSGRYMEALEILRNKLETNNTSPYKHGTYAMYYLMDRNFDEMNKHFNLFLQDMKQANRDIPYIDYIGYRYLLNGDSVTAFRHFEESEKSYLEGIDTGNVTASNGAMHLSLACIYSAMGESEKALKELGYFRRFEGCHIWVIERLKRNPMLDNIRELPEFKNLYAELEGKFNREKEKVRKVLVREGILM